LGFVQITLTTPERRMMRHFSHIVLTLALTFTIPCSVSTGALETGERSPLIGSARGPRTARSGEPRREQEQ
jgi:hypothetical protein